MPYENRNCTDCGVEFEPYQYNQKRCGNCVRKQGSKYVGTPPPRSCKNCGKEFIRKTPRQVYCSKECGGTQRSGHLYSTFGLTMLEYQQMLEDCNQVCSICGNPETASIKGKTLELAVDHCHDTGKIRGLLCRQCNVGLGNFKDSKELLIKAIEYLERSETIPSGSTHKCGEAGGACKSDDIVRSCEKSQAAGEAAE